MFSQQQQYLSQQITSDKIRNSPNWSYIKTKSIFNPNLKIHEKRPTHQRNLFRSLQKFRH